MSLYATRDATELDFQKHFRCARRAENWLLQTLFLNLKRLNSFRTFLPNSSVADSGLFYLFFPNKTCT